MYHTVSDPRKFIGFVFNTFLFAYGYCIGMECIIDLQEWDSVIECDRNSGEISRRSDEDCRLDWPQMPNTSLKEN